MRRLFLTLAIVCVLAFPSFAFAQSDVILSTVAVQLWPEYDQPSMLVIVDFQVAPTTALPASLTFRIPQDANLIAVAYESGGGLANAIFEGPTSDGDEQVFTITVEDNVMYRFEYYQPLTFNSNQRLFSYLWEGAYAVNAFSLTVLQPLDTTSLKSNQVLSIEQANGFTYHTSDPMRLGRGEEFALNLEYDKSTDTLVNPPEGIQPAAPVDEDTPGRISWSNTLPYIIGGLGVVMILGGFIYYWQAGRFSSKRVRRRMHSRGESEVNDVEHYCPQCGTRARAGDRFCRTCGARLRNQE